MKTKSMCLYLRLPNLTPLAIFSLVSIANLAGDPVVLRTLVYHQITSLPDTGPEGVVSPVLSDDGRRAAFAVTVREPMRPVYVVNADGTGLHEVDAWEGGAFLVDISAEGATVVSSNSKGIRIAHSDGNGGADLITFGSGEVKDIRLSGDGSQVFFQLRRNATLPGGSDPFERGIWRINGDGSGLQQLVSPDQVASLVGVNVADVFPFDGDGPSLDVSREGKRIVFATQTSGEPGLRNRVLTFDLDRSELREVFGSPSLVRGVGISGDGTKVAFRIRGTTGIEGYTALFGIGDPGLVATDIYLQDDALRRPTLSENGAYVLFGPTSHLFTSDGTWNLQITTPNGPGILGGADLFGVTMDATATRFLYVVRDVNNVFQLATLDLDPPALGEAPELTEPRLDPIFVKRNPEGTLATISVKVNTGNQVVESTSLGFVAGAFPVFYFKGLAEDYRSVGTREMTDDGSNQGDQVAGDGIYTSNTVGTSTSAETGPRKARARVEVESDDGRRHSTAIEFAPFFVLESAPSTMAPEILSIDPPTGGAGTEVRITGRNFDLVAGDNVVLLGNRVAQVINASLTELVVVVPPGLPLGSVIVTVYAGGTSSNAFSFNQAEGRPVPVLEIYRAVEIRWRSDLDATYQVLRSPMADGVLEPYLEPIAGTGDFISVFDTTRSEDGKSFYQIELVE